jgi:cyclopropane fatty-acyl-phospholipid synthase-like methyltransferase
MKYGEEYYASGNYTNYSEREDRYIHLARELSHLFESLSISKECTILDYGCAKGFLIKGFKQLGYHKIYGYEISEYCKTFCQENEIAVIDFLYDYNDIIVCLDVLEHMTEVEVADLFTMTSSDIFIGRIPVMADDGDNYFLQCSREDPTHINCKTKGEWKRILKIWGGYHRIFHLNLFSLYDSKGVFSFMAIKGD